MNPTPRQDPKTRFNPKAPRRLSVCSITVAPLVAQTLIRSCSWRGQTSAVSVRAAASKSCRAARTGCASTAASTQLPAADTTFARQCRLACARREAEKVRTRLLAQIDERRNPRTSATVAQLLDRHLKESRLGTNTAHTYRGLVDKHVLPFLGRHRVGSIEPDIVDSLYAELQRCREHCSSRGRTDHRTPRPHDCDDRCRPHQCRPLAASSIRQIHWILSGAFRRAVRWRWIAINPLTQVEPPSQPPPTPRPPTAEEAAKILEAAWTDPDWGMLVWLTMVTGQRRGELCALRWRHVDLPGGIPHLQRSIGQRGSLTWEKDTKTHQDRRIVLDPETLRLLAEHRKRCEQRATAVEVELDDEAFVFSLAPDGCRHLIPDSVTQRYRKMSQRLGIKTSIHKLRHYLSPPATGKLKGPTIKVAIRSMLWQCVRSVSYDLSST